MKAPRETSRPSQYEEAPPCLASYVELLRDRAIALGLVADSDHDLLWERHIEDCLRATAAFRPEDRVAYDLGSGAGLPGIVLACALPDRRFRLVEPRRRAAAFLELAVERLRLENVEVLITRAEELDEPADVVTARAFAPLDRSWAAAWRLLRPGGRLVHFSGEGMPDPAAHARTIASPEPPAEVELIERVDSGAPLVIMARG
ncbi:MAG: 16S rRNA (guanine(527)-N(7))-methyltransferase RsmG [Actinomycetota bacterium]